MSSYHQMWKCEQQIVKQENSQLHWCLFHKTQISLTWGLFSSILDHIMYADHAWSIFFGNKVMFNPDALDGQAQRFEKLT